MPLLPHAREVYRRAPALRLVGGVPMLDVIAASADGERVERYALDGSGTPTMAWASALERAIPSITRDGRPSLRSDGDLDDGEVFVRHVDGVAEVLLRGAGPDLRVFRARGMAAAPTAIGAYGGTLVAFHTNVREDSGDPDVTKWIVLRFVDAAGRVHEPAAEMRDRDRDRAGVEQGFEFPSLALGEDGALALLGRGSHDYFRQDLAAAGFEARRSLTDGAWGSRGRRVAALAVGDRLFLAFRDRKGIELRVDAAPRGGAPAFVPATRFLDEPPIAKRIRARRADPAERWGLSTFFGDLQQHSAHSDGVGSADEVYLRARDHYGDDFVALTDHESFLGKRTPNGEWQHLVDAAERHRAPGFETILAYEWTGAMYPGPGHKCVYVPRAEDGIVSRDDVPSGRDLVSRLRGTGVIASPHHIGWTGADEGAHDEEVVPVWEICSCHGCYEHAHHPLGQRGEHQDQLVDAMLAKGLRFGFTASSDSHGLLYHHGECRKRDPYRTGLTAIQSTSLERASLLAALRARRCYATSGAKIGLDVRVDGLPMGSFATPRGAVTVEVHAVGEDVIDRVDLVGAEGTLAVLPGGTLEVRAETRVTSRFVYARVVQRDGEMAWSSPVFFDEGAR